LYPADNRLQANELKETLQQRFPQVEVDISPVSSVIVGNTGMGIFGVAVRSAFCLLCTEYRIHKCLSIQRQLMRKLKPSKF
jgi:hypothetical protein